MHSYKQISFVLTAVLLSWGKLSSGGLTAQLRDVHASSELSINSPEPDYKIFLVRHGNTPANGADLIQGWLDVDPDTTKSKGIRETIYQLDNLGIQEAKNAAEKLSKIDVKKIFSCPLGRALSTAKMIQSKHPNVDIVQDGDLKGLHFGKWEGKKVSVLNEGVNWVDGKAHGGESTAVYYERTDKFLQKLLDSLGNKSESEGPVGVVVSTHQWSIKRMIEYINTKGATRDSKVDLSKYQTGGAISEIQIWLAKEGKPARYHVQRFGEKADKNPLA